MTNLEFLLPDILRLEPHPTARNKAVATRAIKAGEVVFSTQSLVTTLLPPEKGKRCDSCHILSSKGSSLKKCSGCASYWYCGIQCQTRDWNSHHKKICKAYNRFVASSSYQALSPAERVDSIMLSEFVALAYPKDQFAEPVPQTDVSMSTFFDLLPGIILQDTLPPLCRFNKAAIPPDHVVKDIFSRFGNNNFVLHSHLTSFAHGVFPLASRLFNHSCFPTCAAKYVISADNVVRMEIVALRDIFDGDEITISYLDPALPLETRQISLQASYGIHCACLLCAAEQGLPCKPVVPEDPERLWLLEEKLQDFVYVATQDNAADDSRHFPLIYDMPQELLFILDPTYLPKISEEFSRTSHEGDYDTALRVGRNLLALYIAIYPQKFPQTGMHALELAKTAWNAIASHGTSDRRDALSLEVLERDAQLYLMLAANILRKFGPEGDEGGPLEEMRVLRDLLEGVSR